MILKVAYFSDIQSPILSGPSRFAENIGAYSFSEITFTCFTDRPAKTTFEKKVQIKKIAFLCKLPLYWLVRSYLFYTTFRFYRTSFDLIVCSNPFEAFFITLLVKNYPVLVMINDDNYVYTKSNFWRALKTYPLKKVLSRYFGFFIEKVVVRNAYGIITCSNYLKEQVANAYKIEACKIYILYPSVDLSFFTPSYTKAIVRDAPINVLFVKNDWRRGGLETILNGLNTYNKHHIILSIVGITKADEVIIKQLALRAHFKGQLDFCGILEKEELLQKFHAADVYILASHQEAFGISLLEAMATGTPILASCVGGIPEVLDGGKAGLLIEPNAHALRAAFDSLIEHPELVEERVQYGLKHCRKFSTQYTCGELSNILLKLSHA